MLPTYVRNVYFPYALGKLRIFLHDQAYYIIDLIAVKFFRGNTALGIYGKA